MKKLISAVLAFVLVFSLAACAKSPAEKPTEPPVPADLNLENVYQSILDAQKDTGKEELVMFPEYDADLIGSFYNGLADVELKQQVVYMPPVTGYACEIVLVEVADSANVKTVMDIFQARINSGANDAGYPENAVLWQNNAKVQSAGNYVAMVALPDGYVIPENVFAS